MAKVPIKEFDKELVCLGCGWQGKLGDTIGPNEERNFVLDTDDKIWWSIYYNYYCPDCFQEKEVTDGANMNANEGFTELPGGALKDAKGVIVKRDLMGSGLLSDEKRAKIMSMDIEKQKEKLKALGKL